VAIGEPERPQPRFEPGQRVRLSEAVEGIPAGREGRVIGRYANAPGHILVLFPQGGAPLVPLGALEPVPAGEEAAFSEADAGEATLGPLLEPRNELTAGHLETEGGIST
jgi:hypothetical protein